MNEIMERVSVRSYKKTEITKEQIEQLLQAGMQAPSACNGQPWEFIVVQTVKEREVLSSVAPSAKMIASAPLAIVLLANTNDLKCPTYWQQDLGACAQNILLACVTLGLGGCWIGIATNEERSTFIKNHYHLPNGVEPFCILSIGVPSEVKPAVSRYQETKVHYETYKMKE